MKVVAIIQARMGSTRLPGKIMKDLEGAPMLARVVNRVWRATLVNEVVVATTTVKDDDAIDKYCAEQDWPCFRGSEQDVLDRYYRAAVAYEAQAVVRITSDCPLIDPDIIDRVVQEFLDRQPTTDYVSNTLSPRTFPRGLDTEIMRMEALRRAWQDDGNLAWREHVSPFIYRSPGLFHLYGVMNTVDYSPMRWTVDTAEDLEFVRHIYQHFHHDQFSWRDVLTLLGQHPEWLTINRHVAQRVV